MNAAEFKAAMSNSRRSMLCLVDSIYECVACGDPTAHAALDNFLEAVDLSCYSRDFALSLLMATNTNREEFPSRESLVPRVEARLLQERTSEDVEKLMAELR